jgi:hypothetical protein
LWSHWIVLVTVCRYRSAIEAGCFVQSTLWMSLDCLSTFFSPVQGNDPMFDRTGSNRTGWITTFKLHPKVRKALRSGDRELIQQQFL